MIEGISHITFIVSDLDRAAQFLKSVFDAREVYSSGDKTFSKSPEKFFMIGGIWIAVMHGESLKDRTYNHIAFKISEDEFEKYEAKLRSLNIEMLPPRPRVEGEGRSLYFYGPDNHLFELHTATLAERLARYEKLK
jgi:fosfomycin resistance protein FosX